MKNITIRQAIKKDLPAIKQLIEYLLGIENTDDIKKHTKLLIKERVLPAFKKLSPNKIFLATFSGKIVGLIIVEVKHGNVLSIAYIVIDKHYQGFNIGSILVNYAQKYARKIGRKKMSVLVSIENKKAQQFYKKQKFYSSCYFLQKDI